MSKLNTLNVNYLKIPKSIAGRTKLRRGPHVFENLFQIVQLRSTTRPFAQWILISLTCNIPKHWKKTKTRENIWIKCVFCSYFHKNLYCCDRKARAASAQSFTLWQQATIEITRRVHFYCVFAPHIFGCYFSRTSRSWWITHPFFKIAGTVTSNNLCWKTFSMQSTTKNSNHSLPQPCSYPVCFKFLNLKSASYLSFNDPLSSKLGQYHIAKKSEQTKANNQWLCLFQSFSWWTTENLFQDCKKMSAFCLNQINTVKSRNCMCLTLLYFVNQWLIQTRRLGSSQIRGRQKVFTCLNSPASLWQSLGITKKLLAFIGQENGCVCWSNYLIFQGTPQFKIALYH